MNSNTEETAAKEYRLYILQRLQESNGFLHAEIIYDEILARWGHTFGSADMRLHRGRKKWMNEVDFAKAALTSKKLTRSVKYNGGRFLVLMDKSITDPEMYALARKTKRKKKKTSFKFRCKQCRAWNKLNSLFCGKCETHFPPPNKRVHHDPQ